MKKVVGVMAAVAFLLTACAKTNPPSPVPAKSTTPPPVVTESPSPVATPSIPKPSPSKSLQVFPGEKYTGGKLHILVLGSDDPANRSRACSPISSSFRGTRSDAIHIITYDPSRNTTSVANIPRDVWVNVPGYGGYKINAALALGGVPLAIRTIQNLTGIHFNYYMLTTFCGLINMVDAVGGIDIYVPWNLPNRLHFGSYTYAGRCPRTISVAKGYQHLNGCHTLVLARDREDMPNGDVDRSMIQGRILIAALSKFQQMARTPAGMLKAIAIARKNVQLSIPFYEIIALANIARHLNTNRVQNITIPVYFGWKYGQSVDILYPRAYSIFASLR